MLVMSITYLERRGMRGNENAVLGFQLNPMDLVVHEQMAQPVPPLEQHPLLMANDESSPPSLGL